MFNYFYRARGKKENLSIKVEDSNGKTITFQLLKLYIFLMFGIIIFTMKRRYCY